MASTEMPVADASVIAWYTNAGGEGGEGGEGAVELTPGAAGGVAGAEGECMLGGRGSGEGGWSGVGGEGEGGGAHCGWGGGGGGGGGGGVAISTATEGASMLRTAVPVAFDSWSVVRPESASTRTSPMLAPWWVAAEIAMVA